MVDSQQPAGWRRPKASKEPAASALTETPRVDGPGADHFGIQEHPSSMPPTASLPAEPEDWGVGLIDLIAKPGWELQRAKALLRTGAQMPQIEQHLLAKGLSPEAATAAAEWAFEDRIREQLAPHSRADRATRRHRLTAFAAGCALVAFVYWFSNADVAMRLAISLPFCLGWIWFGHYADRPRNRSNVLPPSAMLRWAGWFLFVVFALRIVLSMLVLPRR
jgi:hypothetical protein